MGVHAIQQFATDLRKTLSAKTIENVLSSVFVIRDYASKSGMKAANVTFTDLQLGTSGQSEVPFFTREQVRKIIEASRSLLRHCSPSHGLPDYEREKSWLSRSTIWTSITKQYA